MKSLHHVRAEFEDATLSFGRSVSTRYLAGEFPGFSGRGYIAASGGQV